MDLDTFYKELDEVFKTRSIQEAETFITDSLTQANQNADWPTVIAMANELGGIYRVTKRTEKGKLVYQIALQSLKMLGQEGSIQHGTLLLNLASIYSEAREYDEALKLNLQVLAIYEKEGLTSDYRMAALYNNISHVYEQLGNEDKAIESAEKALALIRNHPDNDVELGTTLSSLASAYIRKGRYQDADEKLMEAERIFLVKDGKIDVHYSGTLASMGELYYRQGKYVEAVRRYEAALKLITDNYGENNAYETVKGNLEKAHQKLEATSGRRRMGLALAEAYYENYGKPLFTERFPEYVQYTAVGLVGEGSECLGFDDVFSEDHDFGPGFCVWLPDEIFEKIGARMQQAYESLPKTFEDKRRNESMEGRGRVGVFSISDFYKHYIGKLPESNVDWLMLPETNLCTATNGKIFTDPYGQFTSVRNKLLQFYPKDVFLKKLVARLATMAQSGQYNYERCMKRGNFVAAYMACSEFIKASASAVFLLNRKYMPFYKWMFSAMESLTTLSEVKPMLEGLAATQDTPENTAGKVQLIEEICILVRKELNHEGISCDTENFLNAHCDPIMQTISDPQIASLPILYDPKQ